MTRALNRSIPFWTLLIVSVALAGSGAWVVAQHLGTMTKTLLDGSATGLEVYGGQSWIVIGAALLGAGALGVLITLATAVIAALLPAPAASPQDGDPVDATSDPAVVQGVGTAILTGATEPRTDAEVPSASAEDATEDGSEQTAGTAPDGETAEDDQNGSSGSTATATKISVK